MHYALVLCSVVALGSVALISGVQVPGVKTSETYTNSEILDAAGNYILFWNFNDTHITFEVHVRTKGWVGFGLSGNGDMYPGDVVVGWMSDDGNSHFSDRHTVGHFMPVMDKSQDWFLLFSEENEFGTVLKFVRKIKTCDSAEDIDISEDTVRIIYAYHTDDPASDSSIMYHQSNRGTKSVSLLSAFTVPDNMPSNVKQFEFRNQNYQMPSDDTMYYCRGFQLPNIGKHHMIKYEPVVTPGNELNVHHILIYNCRGIDPSLDGVHGNCYKNRSKSLPDNCTDIIIAWAIGGEPFYFPSNAGFSIGGSDDPMYFLMETHFDNPTRRAGVIDNSGIRITLTDTLRQYEAGMLQLGQMVNVKQVIPPYQEAVMSNGYCSPSCMSAGFKQSKLAEINIFSALQHSHLLGAGMKTRHFRNGTEMKPLIEDQNYDFNFQENRLLPKEVKAYPGDSFIVECRYDSRTRFGPTFGGLSTKEEMCETFAYYYPKLTMSACVSNYAYDNYPEKDYELHRRFVNSDWSDKTVVEEFLNKTASTNIIHYCYGNGFTFPGWATNYYAEHETDAPYVAPKHTCT